ncbi:hypothetical protein QQG55_44595 [Brugia pahangi]
MKVCKPDSGSARQLSFFCSEWMLYPVISSSFSDAVNEKCSLEKDLIINSAMIGDGTQYQKTSNNSLAHRNERHQL